MVTWAGLAPSAGATSTRECGGAAGDSAIHARESKQFDWLDRRSQRWRTLRHVGRLQLSQNKAGRRTFADRSANRSKRAALRTTNAMESARFARAPRRSARNSDREGAVVCGAD